MNWNSFSVVLMSRMMLDTATVGWLFVSVSLDGVCVCVSDIVSVVWGNWDAH